MPVKFLTDTAVAKRKKDLPLINNVEITDVAAEGNALARINDMVVFIPYGAPGDIADIKIDRKKKNYAEGPIDRTIRYSR